MERGEGVIHEKLENMVYKKKAKKLKLFAVNNSGYYNFPLKTVKQLNYQEYDMKDSGKKINELPNIPFHKS